ncbi:unnamed protein product [Larinioides sclopetarius]|uniref:Uncharacterized protein n=1 Tax=Larinioides sclopetarius TaxID=280406 RepID=A0AAV1YTR2_9ARAC
MAPVARSIKKFLVIETTANIPSNHRSRLQPSSPLRIPFAVNHNFDHFPF